MKRITILAVLACLALFAFWGCSNDTSNGPVEPDDSVVPPEKSCLGCHSSEDLLKAATGATSGSKVLIVPKGGG